MQDLIIPAIPSSVTVLLPCAKTLQAYLCDLYLNLCFLHLIFNIFYVSLEHAVEKTVLRKRSYRFFRDGLRKYSLQKKMRRAVLMGCGDDMFTNKKSTLYHMIR